MARRFPVVISQSPLGHPRRRELEESIVGALLVERGIDLRVIPHLGDLEPGETGVLCLEGIAGPVAVAGWLAPDEALAALASHGITGRRGHSKFDAPTGQRSDRERPIYLIDLNGCHDSTAVVEEIRRIRDDLATPTVSLAGLGRPDAPTVKPNADSRPRAPSGIWPISRQSPPSPVVNVVPQGSKNDDLADAQLDRLVDQLDELDL